MKWKIIGITSLIINIIVIIGVLYTFQYGLRLTTNEIKCQEFCNNYEEATGYYYDLQETCECYNRDELISTTFI